MDDSPLRTHLLDLHAMLEPKGVTLTLGGGYGLVLKQLALPIGEQMLFPIELLPPPRATADLDVLLSAEVVADTAQMGLIIDALGELGFEQEVAKWRFVKQLVPSGRIHVDLLTGPDFALEAGKVKLDGVTAGPLREVGINARRMDEALALDTDATFVIVEGTRVNGAKYAARVRVPHPFTFLITKLFTFDDRNHGSGPNSEDRRKARVQAIDLYRVVGMMTRVELQQVHALAEKFRNNEHFRRACDIVAEDFSTDFGLGILRMRENNPPDLSRLPQFRDVLKEVFQP